MTGRELSAQRFPPSAPAHPSAASQSEPTLRRHDLQGLRGIAVLGVVVYHLRSSWLPGGFAGVDVFFVLSGFFITGLLIREITRSGTVDLRSFWARRARRLLPASMLVIATTLGAGRLLTNPLEAHRIARDAIASTAFGMNWREVASGLSYGQDPDPSPFQHYWSLGVEEQFYLGWPLLLTALAILWQRRSTFSSRHTVVIVAVPIAFLSFLLALHQTTADQPAAYYGTFGRIWQLAVGGLLAVSIDRFNHWRHRRGVVLRCAGVALIISFFVAAPVLTTYPGWWSLVPTLGAGLVVVAGQPASRRDPAAWLLTSRAGQLGGRYSYSWYLWHWAPLVLLPVWLGRPLRVDELWLCAAGTLVLAVLTFHLLEDPVRSSRWLAQRHGGRSLQLAGVLIVVGLLAAQWTSTSAQHAADRTRVVTAGHLTVVPAPAQAVGEEPSVVGDGCQLPIGSAALAPECRYLANSHHGDVVLVGDSHAGMWFPAVEQIARRNRWGLRVWTRTSCPFADVQKTVNAGGEYRNCDRWRADVISRLVAEHPRLVIVASYVQSGLHVDDPRTGKGATQPRAHQLFEAGLKRNLARLRDAGINVLVIADVPAFAKAGPDCVLENAHSLAACSRPESDAVPFGSVDAKAAHAVSGVHLADFNSNFCQNAMCYQVIGNILAYRDMNHLTTEMTLHLAPILQSAIRKALE